MEQQMNEMAVKEKEGNITEEIKLTGSQRQNGCMRGEQKKNMRGKKAERNRKVWKKLGEEADC